MKPIKTFGLAVLAALLAMAFVGASSAMAESTALCTSDSTTCEAVTHVHESTLAGSQAVLKTSILTVKCDVLFLSSSSVTGGAPAIVAGNFTYSNCNNSCVVTEENGPAEIKVLKEGHETSKVTGEGLFHVECGTFIDCLYTGEGLVGTGKGPLLAATEKTNGEVKFSNQKLNEEGGSFFCPDTSELTITTTPLEATYIVGGLHYCVKYEHGGNGHYADEHCTERGNLQTEPYELVVVTNGVLYSVGEVLCVDKYQKNGLWKEVSNGNICKEDGTLGAELYEKGLIKLVK